MYAFIQTPVPMIAAMGVGAAGLLAGAALTIFIARDRLEQARRLMKVAIRYEAEADRAYAKTRALTEPTQQVPVVELFPPSRVSQLQLAVRKAVVAAFERVAERANQTDRVFENPPNWAEGELRRIIEATAGADAEEIPATPPVRPTLQIASYPEPVAEPVRTYEPQVVSRARRDDIPRVPARQRFGSARIQQLLGGPIPVPPLFASLQMPAQRRRPTPLVMAGLPADDTRWMRVKQLAAV